MFGNVYAFGHPSPAIAHVICLYMDFRGNRGGYMPILIYIEIIIFIEKLSTLPVTGIYMIYIVIYIIIIIILNGCYI
nr:MAG TPA: hypothetical protein [Caudoviricetes sp.]